MAWAPPTARGAAVRGDHSPGSRTRVAAVLPAGSLVTRDMRAAAGALALSRARAAAERRDLPIRRRRSLLLGGEAPGYPVSICIFGEWIDRVVASEPLSGPK